MDCTDKGNLFASLVTTCLILLFFIMSFYFIFNDVDYTQDQSTGLALVSFVYICISICVVISMFNNSSYIGNLIEQIKGGSL